jgi:predicted nucleic acid-binding protein
MLKVLVDTDVLIDYSKGYSGTLEELFNSQAKSQAELFINPVIIAEFYTDKKLKNKHRREKAAEFLRFFKIANISGKVGSLAGELLRENRVSFLGDALIAATAVTEKLKLATRNRKHFKNVPDLEFY